MVGALQQAGNMQQRRFSRSGWRDQRDRLSRPKRELGAVKDRQGCLPLHVLALYLVKIDDRYICRPLLHLGLTRTGALRRDRGGRDATTDGAAPGRAAAAPEPPPRSAGRNRPQPGAWGGRKAAARTIVWWWGMAVTG